MKYIVLLCDGLADRPIKELDNKTIIEYANIPIATYNNSIEQYERDESGKFIIVGTWKKDYGEGNHFEGDYNQLPENDVELTPDKK